MSIQMDTVFIFTLYWQSERPWKKKVLSNLEKSLVERPLELVCSIRTWAHAFLNIWPCLLLVTIQHCKTCKIELISFDVRLQKKHSKYPKSFIYYRYLTYTLDRKQVRFQRFRGTESCWNMPSISSSSTRIGLHRGLSVFNK